VRRRGLVAALAATLAYAAAAQGPPPDIDRPAAALRGLDKFSGLTTDFRAEVGGAARYARLEIALGACRVRQDGAGATAWLRIVDGKDGAVVFSGWMFAEDPAVSALDHPRYDVWVLGCPEA
jgi:hypothetical protein